MQRVLLSTKGSPSTLRLQLGGATLRLLAADPRVPGLATAAATPAARILSEEGDVTGPLPAPWERVRPALTLHVHLRSSPDRPVFPPRLAAACRDGCCRFRLARYDLELAWSEASGRGMAALQPTVLAMKALLQLGLSVQLPRQGGLAVHAASLVHGGQAYLFPAASGVGKSTLVRHSGGDPALADEISLVHRGEAGSFLAFPSPFWSKDGCPPPELPAAASHGYPLARLCFLEQAPAPWRAALGPAAATDLLLQHVLAYGPSVELASSTLEAAIQLCRTVPAERIGVPPDGPVWPWLVP